jgi:hypothetical protein
VNSQQWIQLARLLHQEVAVSDVKQLRSFCNAYFEAFVSYVNADEENAKVNIYCL